MKAIKTSMHLLIALLSVVVSQQLLAQANTSLSNLVSPTAVNTTIRPATNNTIDLGTDAVGWRDIYSVNGYSIGNKKVFHLSGINNTFIGVEAGKGITTGNSNTAMGYQAFISNKAGNNNIVLGSLALASNIDGCFNIAIGVQSLFTQSAVNADGSIYPTYNIGIGYRTLFSNTPNGFLGINNIGIGSSVLYNNTTGLANTAIGHEAMYDNIQGTYNVATGYRSLYNSSGSYNTAVGASALLDNINGSYNAVVGAFALSNTIHASYNTAVGVAAGGSYNNGDFNVFIGYHAEANASNFLNSIVIGRNAMMTASNQARIGWSSIASIGGYVNWTNISDGRVKKNMKENVPGLAFINKLKPVTYSLDLDAVDRILQTTETKDTDKTARIEKEQMFYTGFVAQDVEKAAKELGFNFSGVDAAKNDKDLYGLRYAEFVVPLVKAVQELSQENADLKERLRKLEAIVYGTKENLITQKK